MSSPFWQPDSAAVACSLCAAPFTLFNRRHHCRKCGKVVCAACSGQQIAYFANTYVLHASGPPLKAARQVFYRTCDECVAEIRMIRRTLMDSSLTAASTLDTDSVSVSSTTKYDTRLRLRPIDQGSTSLGRRTRDSDSDNNLCPVCGVNLWKQLTQAAKRPDLSLEAFESYKETHVSECLTSFDFQSDNLRLLSPPDGHARNRMLVYIIPPIPKPSYEIISGSESNSLSTLSRNKEVYGLTTSNATINCEKDLFDDECVICLEDLKPGDKVGRLECLCVFHYKCIKDWFNKKSLSECPVHFLHR